jgi:hypothetical protein
VLVDVTRNRVGHEVLDRLLLLHSVTDLGRRDLDPRHAEELRPLTALKTCEGTVNRLSLGTTALRYSECSQRQHTFWLVPRGQPCRDVTADDQEQLTIGLSSVQCGKRIDRVGRPFAPHLEVRDLETRVAGDREAAQFEPMFGARVLLQRLVRRLSGRHQDDAVETELEVGLLTADQVADVQRVEGPAEDADACAAQRREMAVGF